MHVRTALSTFNLTQVYESHNITPEVKYLCIIIVMLTHEKTSSNHRSWRFAIMTVHIQLGSDFTTVIAKASFSGCIGRGDLVVK